MSETETDARLAADLAHRAGQLLLHLRATSELEGRELGRRGDADSNALLLAALAEARPNDAVLSEESADSPERLSAARVWIIDPLDGTREYGMSGRTDWAVHVALWEAAAAGPAITAAAVAQPALDAVYATDSPRIGEGLPRPATPTLPKAILVSDSRPPDFAAAVAASLDAELVPMGSAGAKAMAVVRGEADAYLHAGGQWEWDSAAPVGVALAFGLHASRIDGSVLAYNQPHPYLPDLLICRTELAAPILAAIATATKGTPSP
ncbi:MAG TPA: 3'(2'),5'-bisphosphate nucleotidase CysQ [Jatrophihabitantaceae bacterium]|nr:3'(2'),5'-bisphosphate nucleotidase CysQ [Jatrophihabitantaceae bacterium]